MSSLRSFSAETTRMMRVGPPFPFGRRYSPRFPFLIGQLLPFVWWRYLSSVPLESEVFRIFKHLVIFPVGGCALSALFSRKLTHRITIAALLFPWGGGVYLPFLVFCFSVGGGLLLLFLDTKKTEPEKHQAPLCLGWESDLPFVVLQPQRSLCD